MIHTWLRDRQHSNACGRRAECEKNEEDRGKDRFHDDNGVDNSGSELLWTDSPRRASLYLDSQQTSPRVVLISPSHSCGPWGLSGVFMFASSPASDGFVP